MLWQPEALGSSSIITAIPVESLSQAADCHFGDNRDSRRHLVLGRDAKGVGR